MAVSGRLAALAAAAALTFNASAAASRANPAPKPPQPGVGSWAERADEVCRRGERDRRALLESALARTDRSARARAIELLEGSVGIEGRMLAQLKAIARPPKQRSIIALTLTTLRREYRGDLALLAQLRKRWETARLERQLERNRAWNAQLRLLFVGLGSSACADYFSNPPAYAP